MLVNKIKVLREALRQLREQGYTIGFVPTMGYLHEGHLSLIRRAKLENDKVVVSVFVNPTQFAPHEDFEQYPKDMKRDYELSLEAGADIVFNPEINEMYGEGASTSVIVAGEMTNKLCGASRPTHFKGVTTVVNLLFNIVTPDRAYFGQKDIQQVLIVQKMVRDLHMNIEVIQCPIVREVDGLALSSRNIYLNQEERQQATILYQALEEARRLYPRCHEVKELRAAVIKRIETMPKAKIDYVEILDATTLNDIDCIEKQAILAVAVYFGKTRLIDNCLLNR